MTYKAAPTGPIFLQSRSSRRSRAWVGGTYFRSKERGENANLIKLLVVEESDLSKGFLVLQHDELIKQENAVFTDLIVELELFELKLKPFEEVHFSFDPLTEQIRGELIGIRWQIAGGGTIDYTIDLGVLTLGRVFNRSGISVRLPKDTVWSSTSKLVLKPRTQKFALQKITVAGTAVGDGAGGGTAVEGWSIAALRSAVNASSSCWVRMPDRGTAAIGAGEGSTTTTPGEDAMDEGTDAPVLSAFQQTAMRGGDGLPSSPVGLNTGPIRTLIHLNYTEKDDGSLAETNQVFEWIGEDAKSGRWVLYS